LPKTTHEELTASSCDVNAGRNAGQENFERFSGAAVNSTNLISFQKYASLESVKSLMSY
jgi:hypothetical protein